MLDNLCKPLIINEIGTVEGNNSSVPFLFRYVKEGKLEILLYCIIWLSVTKWLHKTLYMNTNLGIVPKSIDRYVYSGRELASFGYYDGISYCKSMGLHHTTSFNKVDHGTHYMVSCGDVIIRVDADMFPEIERNVVVT